MSLMLKSVLVLSFLSGWLGSVWFAPMLALEAPPRFDVSPRLTHGRVHLQGTAHGTPVFILQASEDLAHWTEIARLIQPDSPFTNSYSFNFLDPAAPHIPKRFYRFTTEFVSAHHDWKNQVSYFYDPFLSEPGLDQTIQWIKFTIPRNEPYRVYYQDSAKYLFHRDFARARLPGFQGISDEAFNQMTLHGPEPEAYLGAVLFPTLTTRNEYGIQLAGIDPYPPRTCPAVVRTGPIHSYFGGRACPLLFSDFRTSGLRPGSSGILFVPGNCAQFHRPLVAGRTRLFTRLGARTAQMGSGR